MPTIKIADLFCGAGGTSAGALEAVRALGFEPELTAINHWDVAIATHTANHPASRHLCTSLDVVNPTTLFRPGELELLWASPECTHHSVARGGKPINDQSRATAWCVVRWAEALRPPIILVENVPEFETWGAIGSNNRPMKSKRGATFLAWVGALESLGYHVDWRCLRSADYGDPTTRRRLFIQAVRGKRKIVWPNPTHSAKPQDDLLVTVKKWVTARDEVIDWTLQGSSIYDRKRPLSPKTMKRIMAGLEKFGLKPFIVPQASGPAPASTDQPLGTVCARGSGPKLAEPFLITMEHRGSERSIDRPMPTITTAKGGAIGLADPYLVKLRGESTASSVDAPVDTVSAGGTHHALVQPFLVETAHGGERQPRSVDEPVRTVAGNRGGVALVDAALLPQQSGGELRPVDQPVPTVATDGAIALVEPFLVKYFGTGTHASVDDPLDTVTAKPRFGLVRPVVEMNGEKYLLDIRFRMLQPHELAAAQGFPKSYQFTGNKSEQVKQIGNAVTRRLARALVTAVLSQKNDITSVEFSAA